MRLVLTYDEALAAQRHPDLQPVYRYGNPLTFEGHGLPSPLPRRLLVDLLRTVWDQTSGVHVDVESPAGTFQLRVASVPVVDAMAARHVEQDMRRQVHAERVRLGQMRYLGTSWSERAQVVFEVRSDDGLSTHRWALDAEAMREAPDRAQFVTDVFKSLAEHVAAYDQQQART